MIINRPSVLVLMLLLISASGCGSIEYHRAVKRGEAPWYVIKTTASNPNIEVGQINVFMLTRKADSTEGQREGLKADKHWGEGHGEISVKGQGEAMAEVTVAVTPDTSDPKTCLYTISTMYADKKGTFATTFSTSKADSCEKKVFSSPYLSGRMETRDHNWVTLDFEFRKASAANQALDRPAAQ